MKKAIYLDMDGTAADFYGVDGWLGCLMNSDPKPYREAKPLINMNVLARALNALKKDGYTIGIVSWLSKGGTPQFNEVVTEAKKEWLNRHLKSVQWDEIHIIPYGTPKSTVVSIQGGYLFDDEKPNRNEWRANGGVAFSEKEILSVLKDLKKVS